MASENSCPLLEICQPESYSGMKIIGNDFVYVIQAVTARRAVMALPFCWLSDMFRLTFYLSFVLKKVFVRN